MTPPSRRDALISGAACGVVALITCAVVISSTPNDSVWIVDAGAKALVAEQLLATGFDRHAFDYPGAVYDPDGAAFPIPPPFAIPLGDGFVSQYPPAYPATAVPFLAAFGPAGLRIPAALGVAACAFLFAFWTTPALGAGRAFGGGIALALATPLLFYGVTIWEHSLTVALPLASVVALAGVPRSRPILAGFLTGIACWYREELVFMLPALAFACLFCNRSLREIARIAFGAAIPGAVLMAFNTAVYAHPFGIHIPYNLHASPPLAESLRDLGALLGGLGASPAEGLALAAAAIASLSLGFTVVRDDRRLRIAVTLAALLGLGAWLRGAYSIATAPIPFAALVRWNGFAVQLPLFCLAGIGFARSRRETRFATLRLGAFAGVFFLAFMLPFRVTLSDFSSGGHWGPRMLLPAAPALVALALAAIQAPAAAGERSRILLRGVWIALVLAGLASSALSVRLLHDQKRETRALEQRILAFDVPVVVTNHPALGQQLPGLFQSRALLLARNPDAFGRLTSALADERVPAFLFVQARNRKLDHRPGALCIPVGRHRGRYVPRIFDVDLFRCHPTPSN